MPPATRTDRVAVDNPDFASGLTRRLAAGDEAAYREFFDRYYSRLSRYLFVVCRGDETAAHEALAVVMDRVVRHVHPFSEEKVFWGWLTVLARTAVIDQQRQRGRYWNFLQRFARFTQAEDHPSLQEPAVDPRALLESALASLAPDERQLVEAKYFQGLTVDRIAAGLLASPKAVESRLTRVRQKLKAIIMEKLQHEPKI